MNKHDKKSLEKAINLLQEAKEIISELAINEGEKFNNMPENLQQTEKAQQMEQNESELNDIDSDIDSTIDRINDLIEQ